jgi:hypothetical protein
MPLFTLLHGKSKKRLKPIMIDERHKVENYQKARENSGVPGWHDIEPAPKDAAVWRQKTTTIRGSGDKHNSAPPLVGRGRSGYISKHGFQENT